MTSSSCWFMYRITLLEAFWPPQIVAFIMFSPFDVFTSGDHELELIANIKDNHIWNYYAFYLHTEKNVEICRKLGVDVG